MENNKTMVLSILGVLVLVVAVVGVSFAMYTFSATGTRQNTITTGTVSLTFDKAGESVLTLSDEYGMSDADAIATKTPVTFSLVSNLDGTMRVNYDIGFDDLTTGNSNLTSEKIMLQITDGTTYYMGTANSGAALSTIAASAGKDGLLTAYVFDSGEINGTTGVNKTYSLKAWIKEDYVLKGGEEGTANNTYCTVDGTVSADITTADACKAANGTWTQEKATTPETFSFKIRVMATQI